MKSLELASARPSSGTYPLNVSLAGQAYGESECCRSLMCRDRGAAFKADEEAAVRASGLAEAEVAIARSRDSQAMAHDGQDHCLVPPAPDAVGVGLKGTTAQRWGETLETFSRTRPVWEQR